MHFETLESRQLASASLNTELIVNGNAEAGLGAIDAKTRVDIPGWKVQGPMTVIQYGSKWFVDRTDPGPMDRDRQFFSGGYVGGPAQPGLAPYMEQTIDVSNLATQIDARQIKFDFSAWLGGFGMEQDYARVTAAFKRADGSEANLVKLVSLPPGLRGGVTGLFSHSEIAVVEPGVRSIQVTVGAVRQFGLVADGYVDNISLKLTPRFMRDTVSGSVFNDLNGDGRKNSNDKGLAGVTVFIDKNKNKKLDTGELRELTDANGVYRIKNVPDGIYHVRMVPPKGFRATTPASQLLTVKAGSTPTAAAFLLSKRALITGKAVWADSNLTFENRIVFADLDNDGERGPNDPWTTTNEKGEFSLILKSGTYTIRADAVEGVKPLKLKLGSGVFSTGHVIVVPPQ